MPCYLTMCLNMVTLIPVLTSMAGRVKLQQRKLERLLCVALLEESILQYCLQQVADLIMADPREIVFTSGATESNNVAIKVNITQQLYACDNCGVIVEQSYSPDLFMPGFLKLPLSQTLVCVCVRTRVLVCMCVCLFIYVCLPPRLLITSRYGPLGY